MNAWVRSQPRTLRPYFGAEAAETLLDENGACTQGWRYAGTNPTIDH